VSRASRIAEQVNEMVASKGLKLSGARETKRMYQRKEKWHIRRGRALRRMNRALQKRLTQTKEAHDGRTSRDL
jgi:hypothetical protein